MASAPGQRFVLDVVRRLADVRRARGITQEALAEKLKTAPRNVQRIEAGQNVTLRTLWRIARALGVEVRVEFTEAKARRAR